MLPIRPLFTIASLGCLVMEVAPSAKAAGIFWTNGTTNTIGSANLDGTGVNRQFIIGTSGLLGTAVDGTSIY